MKAIVVEQAGGPEVLQIRDVPKPEPREGWVLVRVKAFGLNRAELITRSGGSPTVKFPRVIGIECVGIVEAAPGSALQPGQKVAAVMGEMGRAFDGGYEEYALLPSDHVFPIDTDLPWDVFAALPETFLTAAGSLDTMDVRAGWQLLLWEKSGPNGACHNTESRESRNVARAGRGPRSHRYRQGCRRSEASCAGWRQCGPGTGWCLRLTRLVTSGCAKRNSLYDRCIGLYVGDRAFLSHGHYSTHREADKLCQ